MTLDHVARRYGVLPTTLLELTPAELRLVLDCAQTGEARAEMRRTSALEAGAQPVVLIGGGA